MYWEATAVNF